MSQSTILAWGTINASGETITIGLVRQHADCGQNRPAERANTAMRLLAEASTTLAGIKARKRL